MPIRTNRGRAAVYRRLWGWPMRSPRHLAVLVFVVAVLVIAAGIIIPQLTGSNENKTGAAAETTSSTAPTPPSSWPGGTPNANTGAATSSMPTRITEEPAPETAAPAPKALEVADQWAKAWVNHPAGVTNEQWLEPLKPLTTEEQLTEMSTVDPANIVATKVTGAPESVESFTSSVKVKLPTDDGSLLITVIKTNDGWRVTYYEQVDQ
jgi:hypothetical protein